MSTAARTLNAPAVYRAAGMSEADLQNWVLTRCLTLGLLTYHVYRSDLSNPGFPDLVIVGPSGVLFAELKAPTGSPTPEQRVWLAALTLAGAVVKLWKPADLDEINTVLTALARPRDGAQGSAWKRLVAALAQLTAKRKLAAMRKRQSRGGAR